MLNQQSASLHFALVSFNARTAESSVKLERAKQHMAELQKAVQAFFATKPYRLSGKPDMQAGKVVYTMDRVEPTPPEIPLIAGDVIQTLRSGLDHVAYQLSP